MTLVVYMGVTGCATVEHGLLSAGVAANTPVLIVENASLPRERQLSTTLERLSSDVEAHEIASPAVMVIGEVAREFGVTRSENSLAALS